MRNILFDARWLRPEMTGVGYFAFRLLSSLPNPKDKFGIILQKGSPYTNIFHGFRIFETKIDLTSHPLTELFEQATIPWICWRYGYETFVSFEARAPIFHPRIRTCCFVYDLSFLWVKGSHNFKYSLFLYLTMKLQSLFASRMLTISKTVQSQLGVLLKTPISRIRTVYPADSGLSSSHSISIPFVHAPFFLVVGATNHRKNLPNLLVAFSRIRLKYPHCELLITGNRAWIDSCLIENSSLGTRNLGFIQEGELRWLYENASALIYPSFDEGFGIPLVDAAVFDCPIICSDIPVFHEVAFKWATYFDPNKPDSIFEKLLEHLETVGSVHSHPIIEKFKWENSIRDFLVAIGE